MPRLDRLVAGVRCREVLEDLSAWMDGELPETRVARINAHLRDCDWCERFGGRFSAVIAALRQALADAEPLHGPVAERLSERLLRELPPDVV